MITKKQKNPTECTLKVKKRGHLRLRMYKGTWVLLSNTVTPIDSKAVRRADPEWAVRIREAGNIPDLTTPLAMLSAIFPAPIKPTLYESVGIGQTFAIWKLWNRRYLSSENNNKKIKKSKTRARDSLKHFIEHLECKSNFPNPQQQNIRWWSNWNPQLQTKKNKRKKIQKSAKMTNLKSVKKVNTLLPI